ncbi:dermonecrotic toxin domain-containing protein [Pseudomonas sp. Marseille-P9899]|uniref:dermonecrotic toxin domain-containing protein n=1 Tax=Pseudomonas sp. Marseille-P9899 TaxID=2730401 RepID=UPI002113A74A|nr:DUF6543 domain-containing protein [Pseudomonas sp. Marseille-P9899]
MSNPIESVTVPGETPAAGPTPYEVVKRIVPPWLAAAPRAVHRNLRAAGPDAAPWFVKAMTEHPPLARLLQRTYLEHRHLESALTTLLARIPDIEAFAEPLLNAAIQQQFNLSLDVRSTWLFNASRVQADSSFIAISRDPLVESSRAMRGATQTLLRAALQNFESWEAEPGGMQQARLKSSIYIKDPTTHHSLVVEIQPEAFAALARNLDLGGQYLKLIDSVLDHAAADTDRKQIVFKRFEESALVLQAHTAYFKNDIGQPLYNRLLRRLSQGEAQQLSSSLRCSFLTLWNIELTGIVIAEECRQHTRRVLGQPDWVRDVCKKAVIVYIPDDPAHPLKEYASLQQFHDALHDNLRQPKYLKFFERFVPARHRSEVFAKIRSAFYPKVWNSLGYYEEREDSHARLDLQPRPFSGAVPTAIAKQKIAVLRDDAVFHAVPTANEDQKTRQDRLRYFAEVSVDVLNLAAFVMPGLGWAMMAVTAAQLADEIYEGFHSLGRGDREQAFSYLMDVVDNLAQIAALGAVAGAGRGVPALEVPVAVEQMRAVRLEDGSHRLWQPDLRPFAHDIVLPAGLKPNALGLYNYQDKQWLALEGRTFRVNSNEHNSAHSLEHPARANAYRPVLRSNGAGAWLHEADRPLEWEGLALFQRLGPLAGGLSEQTARHLLIASDTHPAQLRRALTDSERTPALLIDALQRLRLDEELDAASEGLNYAARAALFASWYDVLQTGVSVEARLLMETFTGLPVAVAEELLAHAEPGEWAQLRDQHKVALRLTEEARAYQQKVRLARAYEGLYLNSASTADSDRLVLHSLEALPGWSPDVRLEIRSRPLDGPLLDNLGPAEAAIRRVLLKDAEGYRVASQDGSSAEALPDDLLAAVFEALPLAQREALGITSVDKTALRRHLREQPPLPRQRARQVLQMQPAQPDARSPMRLADGRLGYLLSGRGALAAISAKTACWTKSASSNSSTPLPRTSFVSSTAQASAGPPSANGWINC